MLGFAGAIDAIFANPVIAVAATYRQGGTGPGTSVRVIRRRPDEMTEWNGGRFVRDTVMLEVRTGEVSALEAGDTFEIGAETFEVQGEPAQDTERLIWRAEARPL